MLQKHLRVAFVLSGGCSGHSSVGLLSCMERWVGLQASSPGSHWWEDGLSSPVARPAFSQVLNIWNTGLSPCLQTLVYMAGSCLLRWGQSKWCMAGDEWKDHEKAAINWWFVLGGQQASNLAPFYGSASPASARCEWNCLGWCCPLSISLSAGSAGEAFHCRSQTLLSPWQPEIENGERKESNKWRKAKARQRTTKSRMCVKW